MGSLAEFKLAVAFIEKHKIRPVVDIILDGLESAEEGFEIMKNGSQFGKVCNFFLLSRPFQFRYLLLISCRSLSLSTEKIKENYKQIQTDVHFTIRLKSNFNYVRISIVAIIYVNLRTLDGSSQF